MSHPTSGPGSGTPVGTPADTSGAGTDHGQTTVSHADPRAISLRHPPAIAFGHPAP
ncbi:hypothetical protein [Parafrankia colletiae]|uniref:hypothetical protein n=1 Tax=Parafrankia colletiae TaxID=573497 RepID=UPI0018E35F2A|nr:hypothetical protein [Parafrankia colletiae]